MKRHMATPEWSLQYFSGSSQVGESSKGWFRTKFFEDKLRIYICLLALSLENYSIDPKLLTADLDIPTQQVSLAQAYFVYICVLQISVLTFEIYVLLYELKSQINRYFKELGCLPKKKKNVEGGSASRSLMTLQVPLQFPIQRKRAPKTR